MSPFGALLAKFLALAIAAVGSAVIVVAVVSPRLPDPSPIVVMASAPELGWVGAPIPVTVAATSDSPLERFELWVDGALTHTIPIEEQAEFVGTTFDWTGTDPGWVSMRVRAYQPGGAVGESKPVDVQLVSAPGRVIDDDGTADDVADQLGVPLEVLVEHNPGLNVDDLLSAGSWVF